MKKLLIVFLIFSRAMAQTAGYTKVDVTVGDNGEAVASIPFNLPKGTVLQPSLGLSYSSQGNNGLQGLGWSLSGIFQTITRMPATLAQDNVIDPVDFNALDRFAWNGERLVALTGTYGANNTEYRTEQNSFAKIISYGTGTYGPDKFIIYTKDGLILYFGYTADSRIEASGTTDKPLLWLLNRIEDRKGNYLTITYTEENADGAFRPDEINYSGNTVTGLLPYNKIKFSYTNRKDIDIKKLGGGYQIKNSKLLSRVEIFDHSSLHRKYELVYNDYFSNTKLIQVKEKGNDDVTYFKEVNIFWESLENINNINQFTKSSSGIWSIPNITNIKIGDFNGDGKCDLIGSNTNGPLEVCISNGSKFQNSQWVVNGFSNSAIKDIHAIGDFNGDGKSDIIAQILVPNGSVNQYEARVCISDGINKFSPIFLLSGSSIVKPILIVDAYEKPIVTDFNGDGKSDLLTKSAINNNIILLTSTSNNGFIQSELPQTNIPLSSVSTATDFNGDGLPDIYTEYRPSYSSTDVYGRIYFLGSNGFYFQDWPMIPSYLPNASYFDAYSLKIGDFTGEGLADCAKFVAADTAWYMYKSTGKKFEFKKIKIKYAYAGSTNVDGSHVVDLNGDGTSDFINPFAGYCQNGKCYTFTLNTGDTTSSNELIWNDVNNYSRYHWVDIDGDGKNDKIEFLSTTQIQVHLSSFPKDFVTKIKNGNDATFKFEYKPITDTSIYTKGTNAAYPLMDFQGAFHVVSKFSIDNGIGGELKTYYQYAGALVDRRGRGFRGFTSRIIIDSLAQSKTIFTYDRDFSKINASLIKSEKRTLAGNVLVHLVENTPTVSTSTTSNPLIYFSYCSQTKESQYELNSKLIRSKQTNFIFDNYGNPTSITEVSNDGYTVTTVNTYTDDVPNWRLGRVTATTVAKIRTGKPTITKNSTFAYDANGHLIQDILLPSSTNRKLQHDYSLDAYGNTTSLTISGSGITQRTETTTYDSEGRNIISTKNALNHITTYAYTRGYVSSTTDPNGLTTSIIRDAFGREIQTVYPDGTTHNVTYTQCNSYATCNGLGAGCPILSVYYTTEITTGKGYTKTYFDKVDRAIRTEKQGFDGSVIIVDKTYNGLGLAESQSDPHAECAVPYYTTTEYDILQRPIKVTQPGGRITQIEYTTTLIGSYDRSVTKTTNPQNQRKEQASDSQGKLIYVKDHYGSWLYYDYDSDLNIVKVSHDNPTKTNFRSQLEAVYDIRGFKTSMFDYDMGRYYYENNTLGLLTQQTNPKSQISTHTYDLLNRPIQRAEPEGTSTWEYDDATNGTGKPSRVKYNGQKIEEYFYDNKGRLSKTTYYRENKTYDITNTYNTTTGFLETKTYPNGTGIKYTYNTYGYLTEVRNKTTNVLYWKANGINVFDELTDFELGNGLKTSRSYAEYTRYLQSIRTGRQTIGIPERSSSIQSYSYTFSKIGNLTTRQEVTGNLSSNDIINRQESFSYDSLNRVTDIIATIQAAGTTSATTETISYDYLGNITGKSDVGVYNYEDPSRPHLLTSLTNATNTAPCTFPFNQTVEYSSYNYVTKIANNRGDSIRFTYGPARERIIQVLTKSGSQKWRKHYVGGFYEKSFYPNAAGDFVETCFIEAGGQVIAYIETTSRNQTTTKYLHHDHLGSVAVITKENGTIEKRYSYNAWGRQRDPDTWKNYIAPPDVPTNQRGFTFHEMLEIDFLICMNARVYDPVMGRFLSADSYVQFPDDLQSYNRYGYVLNNPLSFTDPTGHFSLRKFLGGAFKIALGAVALSFGQTWLVGVLGNGAMASAIISGASWGFGIAYVSTVISGGSLGDAFKNGLVGGFWGGVNAGLTYGIAHGENLLFGKGGIWESYQELKPIVHGLAQGTLSVLKGGDFKSQFMASMISSGADGIKGLGLVSHMVIGGVTSKLSGGNFVNGAISAAFIEMYNAEGNQNDKPSLKPLSNALNTASDYIKKYFEYTAKAMEMAGVSKIDIEQYKKYGFSIAKPFSNIAKGLNLYEEAKSWVSPVLDLVVDGDGRELFKKSIETGLKYTPLPESLKQKSSEGWMLIYDLSIRR